VWGGGNGRRLTNGLPGPNAGPAIGDAETTGKKQEPPCTSRTKKIRRIRPGEGDEKAPGVIRKEEKFRYRVKKTVRHERGGKRGEKTNGKNNDSI